MADYMNHVRNPTSRSLRNVSNGLYSAARITNDLSALASGDPARVANRVKNRAIMRMLGASGIFRWPR